MSLSASDMKRLQHAADDMDSDSCRGYLSDALQLLQLERDPLAALELLCAMWGGTHAKRPFQKDALEVVGRWLEERLIRDPGIEVDRLALELGWLRRLSVINKQPEDRTNSPRSGASGREPAPFGSAILQLRGRRRRALENPEFSFDPFSRPAAALSVPAPAPASLPDTFEVNFVNPQEVVEAFRTARKRRKAKKLLGERLLAVRPVRPELYPLAADIACSMLETTGMEVLEERTLARNGDPPSFWVSTADLIEKDAKRVPRRISLVAASER